MSSSLGHLQPAYSLGCAYRRIWFSLQGSFGDRNLVSFRGNLTKSSTPNVLSWGHRSPNPQTGCPAIRPLTRSCCVITHGKLWCPLRSWSPRSFFYNLFSNSQPCFLLQWYLQSPEVDMPPGAPGRQPGPSICVLQEYKLLEQQDNPTATSGGC